VGSVAIITVGLVVLGIAHRAMDVWLKNRINRRRVLLERDRRRLRVEERRKEMERERRDEQDD